MAAPLREDDDVFTQFLKSAINYIANETPATLADLEKQYESLIKNDETSVRKLIETVKETTRQTWRNKFLNAQEQFLHELDEANDKINLLSQKLAEVESNLKKEKAVATTCEVKIQKVNEANSELSKVISNLHLQIDNKTRKFEEDQYALNQTNEALQNQLNEQKEKNTRLQLELQNARNSLSKMEASWSDLDANYVISQNAVLNYKSQNATLRTQVLELQKQLKQCESDREDLQVNLSVCQRNCEKKKI